MHVHYRKFKNYRKKCVSENKHQLLSYSQEVNITENIVCYLSNS